ncbi:MAG: cytochrome b/b6 domain-containing protein [Cytophagales bacterium]|nr:cytochrome b/b6 domain-containing protein [Armatimonadota bacterium]
MSTAATSPDEVTRTPPVSQDTPRLVKKHPLAIRWQHWINFPVLMIMMWSGLLILWAYPVYPSEKLPLKVPNRISLYQWGIAPVYPERQNAENYPAPPDKRYDIATGFRLAEGMNWHFTFAWFFTLNGIAYILFLLFSGEWRYLMPRRESFVEAFKVVLHDLKLYRKPLPIAKFNHAQRIAYSSVVVLGFGMVVTGLAIYKPAQLTWLVTLLGGYQTARLEHFWITMLLLAFFFVHIAQVARAGWNNFRAMITGYEVDRSGHLTEAIRKGGA